MLLFAVAQSTAGPPPQGLYECTISEVGLFGDIKVKQNNMYERFGKTGKFTSKGRKLNFTSRTAQGIQGSLGEIRRREPGRL